MYALSHYRGVGAQQCQAKRQERIGAEGETIPPPTQATDARMGEEEKKRDRGTKGENSNLNSGN